MGDVKMPLTIIQKAVNNRYEMRLPTLFDAVAGNIAIKCPMLYHLEGSIGGCIYHRDCIKTGNDRRRIQNGMNWLELALIQKLFIATVVEA